MRTTTKQAGEPPALWLSPRAEWFSVIETLISNGVSVIFSLDKKGDAIVSHTPQTEQTNSLSETNSLSDKSEAALAQLAYQNKVRDLIVLDLDQVGTGHGFQPSGSSAALIKSLKHSLPDLRITSGGGVRGPEDVQQWIATGCDHVLVASAIHSGAFTPDDIE